MKKNKDVVRVGDKFVGGSGHVWEVIETKPGGVLEMFDAVRVRFARRYHREVKLWPRVKAEGR